MTLKTYAQVTKINRKSTSECFRDLEVGDLIEFSCEIKKSGRNHRSEHYRTGAHRTGAQWISCVNQRTFGKSNLSFNQIGRVLECCELVELTAYQFDILMQIHKTRP